MEYEPVGVLQADVLMSGPSSLRKDYKKWFIANISNRIKALQHALNTCDRTNKIDLDYSHGSVARLSDWLSQHVGSVCLSEQEREEIRQQQPFPIAVPESVLSSATESLAFDVGVYLGEVLCKQYPWVAWQQVSTGKRNYFYGQMVLSGINAVKVCPMHIVAVFCIGVKEGDYTDGKRLLSLFDRWEQNARKNRPAA
ncbi:hypothetical protein [Komagataeibacter xylinus]|uniref:hypothetical protein n=1 Tax=Komagataeibacter xylinus TaxID=28448 RepID=UPI00280A66DD|nr:hypothetical protein [Komagataeibacter xylinus]